MESKRPNVSFANQLQLYTSTVCEMQMHVTHVQRVSLFTLLVEYGKEKQPFCPTTTAQL